MRGATITYWVRISEQIAQMRVRLASFCIALAAALLRQADVPTPITRKVTYREKEREREREREHRQAKAVVYWATDKQKLWSTGLHW